MSKRHKLGTFRETYSLGIPCIICHIGHCRYTSYDDNGQWSTANYKCLRCGQISTRLYPTVKIKEVLAHAAHD